jgi:hypothetical protein
VSWSLGGGDSWQDFHLGTNSDVPLFQVTAAGTV